MRKHLAPNESLPLALSPPCPSPPGFLAVLSSSPRRAPGTEPGAPQPPQPGSQPDFLPGGFPRHVPRTPWGRATSWPACARPLSRSRAWAAGRLLERDPNDRSEMGSGWGWTGAGRRRREEDAAPLRCHRRVAGKQLVPAPFRPAPLATRNTMHNNQTRTWSRATRRGQGRAAGGAGAPGSRPRIGNRQPWPGAPHSAPLRRVRAPPRPGSPASLPVTYPPSPPSRSLQSSFPLTLFQATSPSHLTIRGPSFSQ